MDLYDLFMMEAMQGIGNRAAYPPTPKISVEGFKNEANLQKQITINMGVLLKKKKWKSVFNIPDIDLDVQINKSISYLSQESILPQKGRDYLEMLYDIDMTAGDYFRPDFLIHYGSIDRHETFLYQHIIGEIKVDYDPEKCMKDICKLLAYVDVLLFRKAYFVFTMKNKNNIDTLLYQITRVSNCNFILTSPVLSKLSIVFPSIIDSRVNTWTIMPFTDLIRMYNEDCFYLNSLHQNPHHPGR